MGQLGGVSGAVLCEERISGIIGKGCMGGEEGEAVLFSWRRGRGEEEDGRVASPRHKGWGTRRLCWVRGCS